MMMNECFYFLRSQNYIKKVINKQVKTNSKNKNNKNLAQGHIQLDT